MNSINRVGAALGAVLLVMGGSASCSAEMEPQGPPGNSDGAGDPNDFYGAVADLRAIDLNVLEPRNVLDALPNREVSVAVDGRDVVDRFSVVAASGRVVDVAPGEGIRYPNDDPTSLLDEESEIEILAFEDADADERNIVVTMAVDWSVGEDVREDLKFRMGVPGTARPEEFLAGLRALDHIVVILDQVVTGRHVGDHYPVLRGGALGSVDGDGQISFRGLGADETDYLNGIHTLDQLKVQAERPTGSLAY